MKLHTRLVHTPGLLAVLLALVALGSSATFAGCASTSGKIERIQKRAHAQDSDTFCDCKTRTWDQKPPTPGTISEQEATSDEQSPRKETKPPKTPK